MALKSFATLYALSIFFFAERPHPAPPNSEKGFTLSLFIDGITSDDGNIMVAIYCCKDAFLDESSASEKLMIPASKARTGAVQKITLQKGTYAIAVFHDQNSNGKLDRNWFRYPTEPFGFFKGVQSITGPPSFDEVAFQLEADAEIRISLN